MKVLTLHQPWATLIAAGIKTIETRSWSTRYRGPLAIHAGLANPPLRHGSAVGPFVFYRADRPGRGWPDRLYRSQLDGKLPADGAVPSSPLVTALPRGAIVATCTLVDVVPMLALEEPTHDRAHLVAGRHNGGLHLYRPAEGVHTIGGVVHTHFEWEHTDVSGQAPYGHFEPGRFAWLLEDVVPLVKPLPWKGAQGLRDLPDGVLPAPSKVKDLMAALEESVRAPKAAQRAGR